MLTLLPIVAQAQTFTVQSESVLTHPALPNGVGAPTVAFDRASGLYLMYFESELTTLPAGCSEAWVVRKAVSSDGVGFSLRAGGVGPGPLFQCGARHPSLVLHDDGTLALVFQVIEAGSDDGVGIVTNVNGVHERRMIEPLRGVREPTIARVDGEWAVMGVDPVQGLLVARSTDLVSFTFDPAPEIANGATPWSTDGMAMPSLGCVDHTSYPWELYFGGWSGPETGWAWAVSSTSGAWYVTSPYDLWTDDTAWKSLDFVKDGTSTMVYFETSDGNGLPAIGVSLQGSGVDTANIRDRDCEL